MDRRTYCPFFYIPHIYLSRKDVVLSDKIKLIARVPSHRRPYFTIVDADPAATAAYNEPHVEMWRLSCMYL